MQTVGKGCCDFIIDAFLAGKINTYRDNEGKIQIRAKKNDGFKR